MVAIILSAVSLIVQAYTVVVAVRLVTITRHRLAWGSIALGLILIMVRRFFELAAQFNLNDFEPNLYYTLISFFVSACMAVGMHLAKKMIDRMLETAERLTISEAYYRGLMEFGTEAIFVADKDGHYINANHRGLELIGYSAEQLNKLTIYDTFDPDELKETPIRWEALHTGKLLFSQRTWVRSDGSRFVGELHTRQLPDGNLMSSVRDITEHIAAENKLKFQANLLDTVQQAVVAFDLDGKIIYYNEYAVDMYGWKGRDVLGQLATSVIETNVTAETEQRIESCLASGNRWTGEVRYMDVQGNWSPAMLIRSPLYDQHHIQIGSIGISFDLSDLQEAEQAAARAENLLREFIDTAPFGAHHYELTPDGQLIFSGANQTASRMLHLDHDSIVGKRIEDAFPSLLDTPIPEVYRSVALTGVPWESSQVHYSDGMIDGAYEVSAFQTGANRMVALFKDVTDRVRAEEALRQRDIRLRTINDIATGITSHEPVDSIMDRALMSISQAYPKYLVTFAEVDEQNIVRFKRSLQPAGRKSLTGRQVDLSDAPEFLGRLRRSEIIAISSFESLPLENNAMADLADFLGTAAILTVPVKMNGRLIGLLAFDCDKETVWTEYEMKLLLEVGGYLEIAYRNAHLDKFRVSAEQSLRASEERFRTLAENLPSFIWTSDAIGQVNYFNRSTLEAAGCTLEEMVGYGWLEMIHPDDRGEFEQLFRTAMSVSMPFEGTFRFRRKDGTYRHVVDYGVPHLGTNGELLGYIGSCVDLTDRLEAERRFHDQFAQLKLAMQIASSGTFEYDIANNRLIWSEEMQRLYGVPVGSFRGEFTEWTDRLLPEERQQTLEHLAQDVARGGGMNNQFRIRRQDTGEIRWIEARGEVQLDQAGVPIRMVGVNTDITEIKQAESELKLSEYLAGRMRKALIELNRCASLEETLEPLLAVAFALADVQAGGIYLIDGDMASLKYHRGLSNDFAAAISTMPLSLPDIHMVLESDKMVYLPIDIPAIRQLCENDGITHIYAMPLQSGRGDVFGFLNLASHHPKPPKNQNIRALEILVSEAGIIFHRLRTEISLRESEARLAQAQRLAHLGSYEINLATKEAVFSDEVFRILGYEPGSVQPSLDLFAKHIQQSNCVREQAILTSQDCLAQACDSPCRMIRADGVERFVRTVSHPTYDTAGKLQSVVGMIQDVTEQHVAQAALKESEAHYRAIADFTYDWEFWKGADGTLIYVSPSCARITGYAPQDFMSDPTLMEKIIHPDDLERYREHVHSITEGGEFASLEFRIIDRNGEERWIGHVCRPIHDRDGQYLGVRGSNTDITEQKQAEADRTRLEEQLRLAQKLETIGTMAAGIAHDFNNLLVPIIGYTELISSETLPGKFSNEYMQEVLKAAYRAKGLVAHILSFSRQQSGERKPVQIESVIADVVSMLTKTVDSNIQVRFQSGSTTAPVLVDPGQMVQVIMNLCENAVQAMADGGELTIASALFEASPNVCPHCKRRLHGKMVLITVRDTGCGMDDATIKRIFDPFFTTKGVGKGTGMGLAVTHGIVTQHSGHVCASSALGQGSSFHLYLPVAEAIQPVLARTLPQAISGGTERILVIDDEPSVANSQAASLSSLGYKVTVACDPRAALSLFEEKPLEFDCVLLDQRMPELSGDMVAVQLLRIRPDIPIVICSGFSDSLNMRSAQDLGIRDVIMKPIIAADLNRSIRGAIAGTRPIPAT